MIEQEKLDWTCSEVDAYIMARAVKLLEVRILEELITWGQRWYSIPVNSNTSIQFGRLGERDKPPLPDYVGMLVVRELSQSSKDCHDYEREGGRH